VKREAPSVTIVDTTGLVAGKEGLNLKLQKAEILSPTMIIVFKKNSEVDHIIEALLCKKYNVYVLMAPKESKERDMNKRRDYREDIFRKYFEGSKIHRIKSSEDMEINTLVGIFNQDGNTISLGIVLGKENDEWLIYTPMDDIRENLILKKSNLKISLTGREL
ncbi:MAG: Clp1/GlmU family protein, partial [Candidatus Aminicenantia bacterium]